MKIIHAVATSLIAVVTASACGGGSDGPTFPENHPRIYVPNEGDRIQALFDENDPAAVRFVNMADRQVNGDDIYEFRGWMVALAGVLTGDPKYCTFAVAQVDALVNEELATIADGGTPQVAFDSYLYVGEIVGDIAVTYDYCTTSISGDQRGRWLTFADRAVWNVWHPADATWDGRAAPWSGWSVDNPSNNYYYSFLRATMMLGLATHGEAYDGVGSGDEWLAKFRDEKIGEQLIPTFNQDLVGGGSREGTGYGTSMHRLFELYAFWKGSTGEELATLTPHSRATLLQLMHSTVPTLDRFAPVGDQARDSEAMLFDYHRNEVLALSQQLGDQQLSAHAADFLANSSVPEMSQPFMYVYDFIFAQTGVTPQPISELSQAYFAPGVGELYARSGWDSQSTWWNLIAGPYTESHAHHDQGSFMIYKGEWLAYDAVVSSRSGLRQEEEVHNLVRISDGGSTVEQRAGTSSEMVGLARGDGWLHAAANLTPAYGSSSPVTRSEREIVFLEPNTLVIFDRVTSEAGTTQTWQLNSPLAPSTTGASATFVGQENSLSAQRIFPATVTTSVVDLASADSDFSGGYRLEESVAGGSNIFLHVLSLDNDVATATATGDTGVDLTFADGRTATITFSASGVAGQLTVSDSSNTVVIDHALSPGVNSLPE